MEYTMKKALCVGLALAFAPMAVQAQSTTATVTASAVIAANLTVTPVNNLFFGTLAQGDAATVSVGAAATAPQTLGEFQITHNSDVSVSVTPPASLAGPGGSTIPLTFECGYATTSGGAATPVANCALGNTGITTPGTDQDTFVQVGGAIAGADTNVQAGTYSAVLTFNLTAIF
jgi:hypothetical protein